MISNKTSIALRASSAVCALGLALLSSPSFAQDPAAATTPDATTPAPGAIDDAASDQKVIIVTGSRIARPELKSSVPVQVVSQAQIQLVGATNVQDALSKLPAVGQGVSRTSSNFSDNGNGEATINLRNLGDARTLVLVNGRRSVGIPGSSAFDVNNISPELIDHIEVLTGGASAVYGSEAIAGVVNFVLKDEFVGLQLHAQNKISTRGDAADQYASATAGIAFADGRGHIVANFSYDNDHGLPSSNRAYSAQDFPSRSSYAAQGLFSIANPNIPSQLAFNAGSGYTYTFDDNNNLKKYQGAAIDGYNRNGDRSLSLPVQRYLGTVLAKFNFSDAAELYAEGEYSHTQVHAHLEPTALDNSAAPAIVNFDGTPFAGIPITSPYVPAALAAAAQANGVSTINFRRRSNDIFSRSNNDTRDYFRGVIGLRGEFAPNWHYDAYYEHSQTKEHDSSQSIYLPNYGAALNNQLNATTGQVECADAAARAAGCVPINIFGFNTVSAAAAQFLQTYTGPTKTIQLADGPATLTNGQKLTYDYVAKVHQDVVSGNVTGQLFSLWGGPVQVVAGGEYRREKSSENFDPYTRAGVDASLQLANTVGKFNVKEGFGEIDAPIIENKPGFEYLGVSGSARYADYSTVGGVWSWSVSGQYAPVHDIRFRAGFSRATRAPNIGELFAQQSVSAQSVNDPCDQNAGNGDLTAGQTPGTLPALKAGCASIPGVANTVAARGAFYYTLGEIQTITGLQGGNPALRPETADTLTLGVVLTPSFLKNFSFTADFYSIKVKNAIGVIDPQISANECLATGAPEFCDNVHRNASTGLITSVDDLQLNTGSDFVKGLDFEGRYAYDFDAIGNGGLITADVKWSHKLKQQRVPYPGADAINEVGQVSAYASGRLGSGFRDTVYTAITLGNDNFTLSYNVQYLSPLVEDNMDPESGRIGAYWYHGARASFKVQKKFEFYVGVNNIFDKQPPVTQDNTLQFPGTNTIADTYDLVGREFFAGFNAKF